MNYMRFIEIIKNTMKKSGCPLSEDQEVSLSGSIAVMMNLFEENVRKEQDKITRHKCAEAMLKAKSTLDISACDDVIEVDKAHSICINAQ